MLFNLFHYLNGEVESAVIHCENNAQEVKRRVVKTAHLFYGEDKLRETLKSKILTALRVIRLREGGQSRIM